MARILLIALCFSSSCAVLQATRTAAADNRLPATAAPGPQNQCRGMGSKLARDQADAAFRKAEYQKAGQCYLIAGDKPKADLAFIKAAAADNAGVTRQLAANASQAKKQFRQLREAFTSH